MNREYQLPAGTRIPVGTRVPVFLARTLIVKTGRTRPDIPAWYPGN